MTDFFRGWRRKIGVLTLVMALFIVSVWFRRVTAVGSSNIFLDENSRFIGEPMVGGFAFGKVDWATNVLDCFLDRDPGSEYNIAWKNDRCGFVNEEIIWNEILSHRPIGRGSIFIIPYWSIAMPLSLLSAYLLFTKHRKSTPKKAAEPIPNEARQS